MFWTWPAAVAPEMAWLWLLLLGAALGLISLPYQALSSLGLALQQHLWLNSESVSAVAVALVFLCGAATPASISSFIRLSRLR